MWLLIADCLMIWFVAGGLLGVTLGRVVQERDRREAEPDSSVTVLAAGRARP